MTGYMSSGNKQYCCRAQSFLFLMCRLSHSLEKLPYTRDTCRPDTAHTHHTHRDGYKVLASSPSPHPSTRHTVSSAPARVGDAVPQSHQQEWLDGSMAFAAVLEIEAELVVCVCACPGADDVMVEPEVSGVEYCE